MSGSDDVVTVSRLVFNDSSCDKVLCPSVRLSVCLSHGDTLLGGPRSTVLERR